MWRLRSLWLLTIAFILVTVLAPFVFIVNTVRFWNSYDYWFTVAVGLDQLGGSILYNEEDYTVSSYTYWLCYFKGKYCWFMKFIDFLFGKGHCQRSFYNEQNKMLKEVSR